MVNEIRKSLLNKQIDNSTIENVIEKKACVEKRTLDTNEGTNEETHNKKHRVM
jgi:hypothetical protein